jgi:pimeloyl-ACP methyl ester carboxylesterase
MKVLGRVLWVVAILATACAWVFYEYPLWVNDQQIHYHLWRSGVRSEYMEVRGPLPSGSLTPSLYRLHYFEALPPDGSGGVPLVLVHGLGARGEDWTAMIPTLAASGFHVYAPDLLGHGRSERPDVAYSIPLEENVVVEFMHAMGLAHADVDGWSMGGWIAAKMALDHPEMVDRLVLDDSVGLRYQPAFARDAFVPTDAASLNRLLTLVTPDPPTLPGFVVRATLRKVKTRARIVQELMDSMETGRDLLDARVGGIRQPTLIVWGTEDRVVPISVGEEMHREIAGSVFESVPGCGHLAPAECSGPVAEGTVEFLKAEPAMVGGERVLAGAVRR